MNLEVKGLDDLTRGIDGMAIQVQAAAQRALKETAIKIWTVSINNAPRSPTQDEIDMDRAMKAAAKGKKFKKRPNRRKADATSRPEPGELRKSIAYEVIGDTASIFVASNSKAGKYAKKMHDERGKTWNNLGPGSENLIKKGQDVGDKFIERAFNANEVLLEKKLKQELNKVNL